MIHEYSDEETFEIMMSSQSKELNLKQREMKNQLEKIINDMQKELCIEWFVDKAGQSNSDLNDIDFRYHIENIDGPYDWDTVSSELLDKGMFNVEIIYYRKAMAYLLENDDSLRESLEIADEMGYELSSLNSEVLASLLATKNVEREFIDLRGEYEDYYEEEILMVEEYYNFLDSHAAQDEICEQLELDGLSWDNMGFTDLRMLAEQFDF